ncbi:hypothetical protein [Zooshikella ganghwensis]|uniref:WD40 repeat domain-containing protein n=1 Tax=Zooshikella ganghwensis TaxID=202772 RepID=A0A4P9VNH2_9GAMM|nr:hypothetical protein [Zooshikella ganghwensis]RDH44446.1 hypothetical protein B9G39_13925 [Zooshikella ganghwensis]
MRKINLPRTSERIRGISLPENGFLYVCDYDEVFKVIIGDESEAEILDDDPYEFMDSLPHSLGISGGKPLLEINGNKISYDFKSSNDSVSVNCNIAGVESIIEFSTFSGDWFAASFSPCGKYIVLAEPYDVELYEV